nr:DUF4411 family protein [Clavibacter michiganensis]
MYLLDTNVFIEAKNRYYAFDLAPGFWDWLEADADAGVIGSIEEVNDELVAGADELAGWARAHPDMFESADQQTALKLAELATWASSGQFTQAAVDEFLDVADYYLVAHAAAHGHTVVTHEIRRMRGSAYSSPTHAEPSAFPTARRSPCFAPARCD